MSQLIDMGYIACIVFTLQLSKQTTKTRIDFIILADYLFIVLFSLFSLTDSHFGHWHPAVYALF